MGSCPGTFLNNKSKMTCDCRVFIIPQRSVKGKHLMGFQLKFLRPGLDAQREPSKGVLDNFEENSSRSSEGKPETTKSFREFLRDVAALVS